MLLIDPEMIFGFVVVGFVGLFGGALLCELIACVIAALEGVSTSSVPNPLVQSIAFLFGYRFDRGGDNFVRQCEYTNRSGRTCRGEDFIFWSMAAIIGIGAALAFPLVAIGTFIVGLIVFLLRRRARLQAQQKNNNR